MFILLMKFSIPLLRPRRKCPYALKTLGQVPLFYGVGGWADFSELLLCHGVKGYAYSGPGLESVEE
jgi:hypothetical protein